jgi:hypothetical protein
MEVDAAVQATPCSLPAQTLAIATSAYIFSSTSANGNLALALILLLTVASIDLQMPVSSTPSPAAALATSTPSRTSLPMPAGAGSLQAAVTESPAHPPHLRLRPASPNPSLFRFSPCPPLPLPLPPSPTPAALTYTVFSSSTFSLLRAYLSALDYTADSDCLHIRPSAPRCRKCIPCKKRFHFAYLPTLWPARYCPITLTSNSIASRNLGGKVKTVIAKPTVFFLSMPAYALHCT